MTSYPKITFYDSFCFEAEFHLPLLPFLSSRLRTPISEHLSWSNLRTTQST